MKFKTVPASSFKDGQSIKLLLVIPLRAAGVIRAKIDTLCFEKSKIVPHPGKAECGLQWENARFGEINLK